MQRADVIVFGGYGTFGRHIVRELACVGLRVTIAGRHRLRAEQAARDVVGDPACGIAADVADPAACRRALAGHRVAVNAAGPFAAFETTLLDACLDAGCHYVDIADDRAYIARLRARSREIVAAGLSAAYGCSSLPGISGAVASRLSEELTVPVDQARVTLFIGNRNPKGLGAVRSAAAVVGMPIDVPQGVLVGFGDAEGVPLFPPFGTRRARNFNSPDYDLLPELIGVNAVTVKVGFELPGVTAAFGLAARYAPALGRWLIPKLVPFSGLAGWFGSSGGQVMVELFAQGQRVCRGAVVATENGQRLAALPAVYVAQQFCQRGQKTQGLLTAYEAVGARKLVELLVADGYAFRIA